MPGRVVRKLTQLVEQARGARAGLRERPGRGGREVHDERLAQKAALDAEARRYPSNHPGAGGGFLGGP